VISLSGELHARTSGDSVASNQLRMTAPPAAISNEKPNEFTKPMNDVAGAKDGGTGAKMANSGHG